MQDANRMHSQSGSAMLTVMSLIALLSAILTAFFLLTRMELSMTKSSMDSNRGYYAAEAGANLRSEAIRQAFLGFSVPVGTPPPPSPGQLPCQGSQGSGDFACQDYPFKGRSVITYVDEKPGGMAQITIPAGEPYAYLNAGEFSYVVNSVAHNPLDRPEASLEMHIAELAGTKLPGTEPPGIVPAPTTTPEKPAGAKH